MIPILDTWRDVIGLGLGVVLVLGTVAVCAWALLRKSSDRERMKR
jgi:hypothetical protein